MKRVENIITYRCAKCQYEIKVPKEYLDQFKSGGEEYHPDGESHLVCPNCGEMIEIK